MGTTIQRSFCAHTKCFTCDASAGGVGDISFGAQGIWGAHVQVSWDTSAGQTAALGVNVFGSADGTLLDTIAITQYQMPVVVSSQVISSFILEDLYHAEISCKTVGGVSAGDVSVSYSAWDYTSA